MPRNDIETVKKKLYSNVLVTEDGCWEWQKYRVPKGYGVIKYFKETLAHRVSFTIHCGPILKGLCVLHKCDNPPCINPDHLFLGTIQDNNKDRDNKGRTIGHNSLKTHCKRGHEFTEENTFIDKKGYRVCRKCQRIKDREYYHKNIEGSREKQREYRRNKKLKGIT